MKTLLLATGNSHKTEEIQAMLGEAVEVSDLSSFPELGEIIEDAETFQGNADIKALAAAALTDQLVLADDSGLCVPALGGEPGVRSARYAGENATMVENKARLLKNLDGITDRSASFMCVLSVVQGGEVIQHFTGECKGRLLHGETGEGGFGYDPLFVPEGYEKSFAELPGEVKNKLSHRGIALEKFKAWIASQ